MTQGNGRDPTVLEAARAAASGRTSWGRVFEEILEEGNVLVFGVVGVLALGTVLQKTHRYTAEQAEGLPYVEDSEGMRYGFKLLSGGRGVAIYLPMGTIKQHQITPLAARDPAQLEAEVAALVADNYFMEG